MEFLGKRVRVRQTAESDLGQQHAGEYGKVELQVGALREGVQEFQARLDSGPSLVLQPDEVEILD